jgi:hypothetical protein
MDNYLKLEELGVGGGRQAQGFCELVQGIVASIVRNNTEAAVSKLVSTR